MVGNILGKLQQLYGDQVNDLSAIFGLPMFNDMLSNVIAVLVLNERIGTHMKLLQDGCLGLFIAVLQHPLNHSAAVWVSRQRLNLPVESVNDELDMFSRYTFDCFLDDVVPVLVLDAF